MESVGIASTSRGVRWADPLALIRSSLLSVSILLADVTIGAIRLLVVAGLVTGRSCVPQPSSGADGATEKGGQPIDSRCAIRDGLDRTESSRTRLRGELCSGECQ
jgi:hypothetical protein